MIPIQRKIINYNKYPNANKIEYIVIHDTGNSSPTANAMAHYNYFSGGNRGASAHYFIDKDSIVQIIDDKDGSWAVGDGGNKYGIHNKNNISLEMCINDMKNIDKVVEHTADLTVYLMKKYNIGIDRLVRHYDASRKRCPSIFADNNWAKWTEFKNRVQEKLKGEDLDMTKEELNKLLDERDRKLIQKIQNELIIKGETKNHWADIDFNELNDFLDKNKIDKIIKVAHNDLITRGEAIRMINLERKATLKEVENIIMDINKK